MVKQSPLKANDLIWTRTKCLLDPFSFTLPVVTLTVKQRRVKSLSAKPPECLCVSSGLSSNVGGLRQMPQSASLCVWVLLAGKKQDLWYVVDLLTGEKQQTLTSSYAEMLCPSSSLLYLGRTGKSTTAHQQPQCSQPTQISRVTGSSAATFVLHFLTSTSCRGPSLPPVLFQPPSSSHIPVCKRKSRFSSVSAEYTITMYDTKSRELRWNATYSDYASTLPDDDTKYSKTLHSTPLFC